MNVEELLEKLEANASATQLPVSVEIENVGTIYVRRRTILEFEQMQTLKTSTDGGEIGVFAPSIARLLCDETGKRFPLNVEGALADLLAKQPEDVFHKIINAADGNPKPPTAEEPVPN